MLVNLTSHTLSSDNWNVIPVGWKRSTCVNCNGSKINAWRSSSAFLLPGSADHVVVPFLFTSRMPVCIPYLRCWLRFQKGSNSGWWCALRCEHGSEWLKVNIQVSLTSYASLTSFVLIYFCNKHDWVCSRQNSNMSTMTYSFIISSP